MYQFEELYLIQAFHDQYERDYPKKFDVGVWSYGNAEISELWSSCKVDNYIRWLKDILSVVIDFNPSGLRMPNIELGDDGLISLRIVILKI